MMQMNQEVFPEIDTNLIMVTIPYPAASPDEVEAGVVIRVEEAIEGIEGIERIRSTASESEGIVLAELEERVDSNEVLKEIESAVNRITTFPQEMEEPIIRKISNRVQVLSIVVSGETSEKNLKEIAEKMRSDLTAIRTISQVEISGLRRYEISIEISKEALQKYGLTFGQVANIIKKSSLDLPGGSIKTKDEGILVRTKEQRYRGQQFENLILITRNDGTILRLGEIAQVTDGFEDADIINLFDGQPAAMIKIYRVGEQNALETANTVKDYLKQQKKLLPPGISANIWLDQSRYLQERIELLIRNGYLGLILVFLCLALFLNPKLAFWTTIGILISFMGAFCLLALLDVTINMISLFAFIVVLGIVVDDAIVVGENIFSYRQKGMDPISASIKGVMEMAAPVTIAILTTVVAFMPLLFTSGEIGKIMRVIPVVVIAVLLVSLVEAMLILPAHLSGAHNLRLPEFLARTHLQIRKKLDQFIQGPYMRALSWAIKWRYLTIATALSLFAVTIGFVAGGHIKFVFFEMVDSDNVVVQLTMPQGTTIEQTQRVVKHIEKAATHIQHQLDAESVTSQPSIFKHMSTTIGQQPFKRMAGGPANKNYGSSVNNAHLAEINIELVSSEYRAISAKRIENRWREEVGQIPGIASMVFKSAFYSVGEAVNVELSHTNFDTTLQAVENLKKRLRQYQGVSDVKNSFLPGKRELLFSLKDEGRTLGLTLTDVALQVRDAFYGAEAQRIQRGSEDLMCMVRYPKEQRSSLSDISTMRIRLPDGTETPFQTVAQLQMGRGYAQIDRADGRRVISVTAKVDESLSGVSSDAINSNLATLVLPELQRLYPGLLFGLEGKKRERDKSMESLKIAYMLALLGILCLLGIQFRSYLQPLIDMSAIPLGLIGALIGHLLMGVSLSFLSFFGVVALTGVVVNDSLIMIDTINRKRNQNETIQAVVIQCSMRRFRPILLTTLTTFLGLTPMLLESSLQARFLIPMVVSLAFGVLFATIITLILVPALYIILIDLTQQIVRIPNNNPVKTVQADLTE